MNVLYFIISLSAACTAVWFQTNMLRMSNVIDRIVVSLNLFAANIILTTFILTLFLKISAVGYVISQALIAAVSAALYYAFRNRINVPYREGGEKIPSGWNDSQPMTVLMMFFLLAVAIAALVNLFLAVYVPPNNYDSMTYHMSKVGYWSQFGSLSSYTTDNFQQTQYPANAEILILWTVVLMKSDRMANLIQWFSYLGIGLVIYRISSILGYRPKACLFATLVYLSLPMVVLQSTTTQNDLVVAFFVLSSFYFFHSGLKEKNGYKLLLSGLVCGLAFGTKGTTFFIIPGYFLASLLLLFKLKIRYSYYLRWVAYCVAGILLLGSYFYIQNYKDTGHPLGSEWVLVKNIKKNADNHSNLNRKIERTVANLVTVAYKSIEFTGLPDFMNINLYEAKKNVGRRFVDRSFLRDSYNALSADAAVIHHDDSDWFGFIGFFLYMPLSIMFLWRGIVKKKFDEKWVYPFVALFFIVFFYFFYPVPSPYNGRYFVMPMAFIAPLVAALADKQSFKGVVIFVAVIVLISMNALYKLTTGNSMKPLIGNRSVFNSDYYYKRAPLWGTVGIRPFIQFVEEFTQPGDRIGHVNQFWRWDYHLFGSDFARVVIPVTASEYNEGVDEIMTKHNLDFLVIELNGKQGTNSFDPVFHGEGDASYRVLSRRDWETAIEKWVHTNVDHKQDKIINGIAIFSAASNLNTPLRILFEYAQKEGMENQVLLADTKKMSFATKNMSLINSPITLSGQMPLIKQGPDQSSYSILARFDRESSLQLQGTVSSYKGSVQIVSDAADLNITIPTKRDGKFAYTLNGATMSSTKPQWNLLQLKFPDGVRTGSFSAISVYDPKAPVSIDLLADEKLLDGFYGLEGDKSVSWRWANGNASITFPFHFHRKPLYLHIRCERPPWAPQKLNITFNKRPLGPILFEKPEAKSFQFVLPAGWLSTDGVQSLRFTSSSFVPAEEGINSDTRRLGVRIFDVVLSDNR